MLTKCQTCAKWFRLINLLNKIPMEIEIINVLSFMNEEKGGTGVKHFSQGQPER